MHLVLELRRDCAYEHHLPWHPVRPDRTVQHADVHGLSVGDANTNVHAKHVFHSDAKQISNEHALIIRHVVGFGDKHGLGVVNSLGDGGIYGVQYAHSTCDTHEDSHVVTLDLSVYHIFEVRLRNKVMWRGRALSSVTWCV